MQKIILKKLRAKSQSLGAHMKKMKIAEATGEETKLMTTSWVN